MSDFGKTQTKLPCKRFSAISKKKQEHNLQTTNSTAQGKTQRMYKVQLENVTWMMVHFLLPRLPMIIRIFSSNLQIKKSVNHAINIKNQIFLVAAKMFHTVQNNVDKKIKDFILEIADSLKKNNSIKFQK